MIICGNKMPTRCNRCTLLQILLLAQHVEQAIRSAIKIHLLHLFGVLFPHIIDDARLKPHHISMIQYIRIYNVKIKDVSLMLKTV
jgi:hypothetical protein